MVKDTSVLENKTEVFYTVHINDTCCVIDYTGRSATVGESEKRYAREFTKIEEAGRAAMLVNGKVLKHTKHRIITIETEEVPFNE
ncbi:hypothetical protein HF078_06990 [Bacillus sp. RO2]|uniref:hypothetical protein n=1 Tax=Bacillus sp. RO2 TaxID=2723913 RepID=UPI00145F8518|nr:hypothetical protein [Bacillus sp. RO2]NMH72811.1 hypothetical protein [Bacillus sp. RO2]